MYRPQEDRWTSPTESGRLWGHALDAAVDPMFVVDTEMRIVRANAALATRLECTPADLVGRHCHEIFLSRERDTAWPHTAFLEPGVDAPRLAVIEHCLGGEFQIVVSPIRDAEGTLLGTLNVAHDVSRWLHLEAVARRASCQRLEAELARDETVSFEALLGRLSGEFVGALPEAIDDLISRSLEEICLSLGIDRGVVWQFEGEDILRLTHSRSSEDYRELAVRHVRPEQVPWIWSHARRGRTLCVRSVEDLPREASQDAHTLQSNMLASHLLIPLKVGNDVHGVLSFGSKGREFDWSERLVARLVFLGSVFSAALGRKLAQEALSERAGFEEVFSDLSAILASTKPGAVGHALDLMLARICKLLKCQRGVLLELPEGSTQMTVTRLHAEPGAPPLEKGDEVARSGYTQTLLKGDVLVYRRPLEDLPTDATYERDWVRRFGVGSYIAIPISVRGRVVAAIAFESIPEERAWSDELVGRLGLVAELMASALDRQQADAALLELRANLAHMGRLLTAGELAAAIAHELNQPLTAILSNARAGSRFLARGEPDLVEIGDILEDVAADAQRAGAIIRRLREYVRRGAVQQGTVDIGDALEEVGRLVANEARLRKVDLHVHVEPGLPQVRGDRVQLQQVVLNLAMNALEAMDQVHAHARRLAISCCRQDGQVVVGVDDTGPGVPPEGASIFEAFVTTKHHGMGMGLAIARTIVEAHGGSLELVRRQGHDGARFEVRLPDAGLPTIQESEMH